MSYEVEWTKPALKELKKLNNPAIEEMLCQAIDDFINGSPVDIKKLKTRKNEWRIAVDDWRIIIEKDPREQKFRILDIVNRQDAYRGI